MSISALSIPIDISKVKRLNLPEGALRKLSDVEVAQFKHVHEMALMPEYSRVEGPADTVYAEVKVGGQTVATLYNSGVMVTSNAYGARLQNLPSVRDSTQVGPALAQERAEEIARTLGGNVVRSGDAMTQSQWEASPKQKLVTDWEALRRDPRLIGYHRVDPATLLDAQEA